MPPRTSLRTVADPEHDDADPPFGHPAYVAPVRGQLVEIWQANAAGRYRHDADRHDAPLDPNFSGAGRCLTGADGGYRFVTVKPGAYPWQNHDNAWRPAHVHLSLFGHSFAERLVTRMYFPDEEAANAADPVLARLAPAQRATLVAEAERGGLRFDIRLQGEGQTVFFAT